MSLSPLALLQQLLVGKSYVHRQEGCTHVVWKAIVVLGYRLPLCSGCILFAPRFFSRRAQAVVGLRVVGSDVVVCFHYCVMDGVDIAFVGLEGQAVVGAESSDELGREPPPATHCTFVFCTRLRKAVPILFCT